jgi:LCP family protein required for cell wall assembly
VPEQFGQPDSTEPPYGDNIVPDFAEKPKPKPKIGRIIVLSLVGLLVLAMIWPVWLLHWGNGQIRHVDALSGAPNTPGTTFLLVGTDERTDDGWQDETLGVRSDSIMVLHRPRNGTPALVSLPRDSYVEIPGYANNKLNAAYALGGAPLLVKTVENLTGLTIDHYIEIGMGGLIGLVDAVGGVELCLDMDVRDWRSALYWTAGCHVVNGRKALAFSRMRYSDPTGDIGRTKRQRQVISAITHAALEPSLLRQPSAQRALIGAGLGAIHTDEDTNIMNFAPLALTFRAANGPEGFNGTPPISEYAYRPGGNVGAAVRLDPELIDQFWSNLRTGNLEPTP